MLPFVVVATNWTAGFHAYFESKGGKHSFLANSIYSEAIVRVGIVIHAWKFRTNA